MKIFELITPVILAIYCILKFFSVSFGNGLKKFERVFKDYFCIVAIFISNNICFWILSFVLECDFDKRITCIIATISAFLIFYLQISFNSIKSRKTIKKFASYLL